MDLRSTFVTQVPSHNKGVAIGTSWGDRRLWFRHFRGYRRICRADGFFPEEAVLSRGRKRAEHTFPSIFVRHFSEHLLEASERTHAPLVRKRVHFKIGPYIHDATDRHRSCICRLHSHFVMERVRWNRPDGPKETISRCRYNSDLCTF